MQRLTRIGAALLLMGSLTACSMQERTAYQAHSIGTDTTVTVGSSVIDVQRGTMRTTRQWVGLMQSPDGWLSTNSYTPDYYRRTLTYAGKIGSVIELEYSESKGTLTESHISRTIKYDLDETRTLTFQEFRIEVLAADASSIRFRLLSDGKTSSPTSLADSISKPPQTTPHTASQQARSQYAAEQVARDHGCGTGIRLLLVDHPREVYQANCPDGRGLTITCEWGKCHGQ